MIWRTGQGVRALEGTHVSGLAKVREGVGEVGNEEGKAEVRRRAVDEVEAVGEGPESDGEVHGRWVDGVACGGVSVEILIAIGARRGEEYGRTRKT